MQESLSSVQLSYENSIDDAVAFSVYHCKHSPVLRRRRITLIALLVLWIFGVNFWAYGGFSNLAAILLYSLEYVGVAALSILLLRWLLGDRLIRKQYAGDKNRGFLGRHELEIVEEGLKFRTAYSEGKFAWGMIERIASLPDYTFIYTGTASALIIPHARITEGNYSAFLQELGRRFKADQPLRGEPAAR